MRPRRVQSPEGGTLFLVPGEVQRFESRLGSPNPLILASVCYQAMTSAGNGEGGRGPSCYSAGVSNGNSTFKEQASARPGRGIWDGRHTGQFGWGPMGTPGAAGVVGRIQGSHLEWSRAQASEGSRMEVVVDVSELSQDLHPPRAWLNGGLPLVTASCTQSPSPPSSSPSLPVWSSLDSRPAVQPVCPQSCV